MVPASPEQLFDFFVNQANLSGHGVIPGSNQIQILQDEGMVTIDIYPGSDQPGFGTEVSVFWYGEG